ncbi:hypothetical protein CRG98_000988 [Punica granatum]|uniref:Tyrosine decarboxylase 1-like n=1 Tax=Punica granatum TaxID=22663 RepID=A0A2I0LD57_PUNGR|nr:hypothetical protein CRG98_000988 [Punica granatum]
MGSLKSEEALESNCTNPLDPDEFRRQGHMIIDFLADYYKTIEDHPSNASTAGILGEILCSGFGVVGFSWVSSPAATELESLVMEWLGEMLKLPRPFLFSGGGGGVIHGNTCEAIICTLAAARDKVLREIGEENITKLVVYCSDQTHCSFKKAAQVVGINAQNIRAINTTKVTEFGMCPSSLKQAIARDIKEGLVPLFNAHKWLLTGLDCCCLWVKDSAALRQALSSQAECLRNKPAESKKDDRFEVVCKRNFALVCFRISPSALGKQVLSTGYLSGDASIDNDNIKDGHTVEEPVTTTANINDVNKRLLEEINGTGRVFMTHAVVGGVYAIRFAVGATLVQERHVRFAWKLVQGHADAILRDRP